MNDQKIVIKNGSWLMETIPNLGANITALRLDNQDVLIPWTPDNPNPYLMGAPLLLPANRTAGGCFSFAGKQYTLPLNEPENNAHLHGQLHRQAFSVLEASDTSVTMEYENHGEIYPFPFRICVNYQLSPSAMQAEYQITNTGSQTMPLTFALHTTFVEPDLFRVPIKACQERDSHLIPTGRYLPLTPDQQTYVTGSVSRYKKIVGYYQAAGNTAYIGSDYTYDVQGFDHWILYNGNGTSGFLCVEPQLGGVNCLNDEAHCPIIQKDQTLCLKTTLTHR